MRTANNAEKNKQEQPKSNRGGFRQKKHFKKLSLLVIALVIGLSSVLTLFTPESASAINTSESKKTDADWQIRSLILYRALGDCIANSPIKEDFWSGQVNQSDIRSGNWFGTWGINPGVGPYFRGDVEDNNDADIRAACTTPSDIVNRAMTLWGFDKEDFFCNIGGKRLTGDREGKDCLSSSGATGNFSADNVTVAKYREYVQETIYGKKGTEPALSKEAYWYVFYYKVFMKSCAYKRTELTNPDDIKALDIKSDSTSGYKIMVAQPDGTTKDAYYSGGLVRTHTISTRPAGIEGNVSSATVDAHCGNGGSIQIEERLNHYAPGAALLMKSGEIPVTQLSDADIDEDKASSCSVDGGLGWLLCPLANLAASLTDSLFEAVSAFLRVAPVNLSPTDNPLYSAWATMRTIANVAFVIVFLIIIFSQLSSLGITNYGVKKMLPRLVVAAILVNLSFYICAIAVDVSNIVGVSLQDVFSYISQQTASSVISDTDNWGSITTAILSGSGTLLAAGAFVSIFSQGGLIAALAGMLPLLFGALFALIVAFLVLLARQALIIMAIVIAPLAFVAYLLPNTESWFKKWRDLFITLLALFPMMSIVFGGSQLAAVILRESSAATLEGGEDMIAFFLYIGSFAVQAIPFFITPVLIKLSSGVLGRFAGLVNNPNKGPLDRARKWAEGKAENAKNRGYQNKLSGNKFQRAFGVGARMKRNRDAVHSSLESEAQRAEKETLADKTKASARFQRKLAGNKSDAGRERALSKAIDTKRQMRDAEVKAGDSILEDMNLSGRQRTDLALGRSVKTKSGQVITPSETLQKAAIVRQMETGSFSEKKELIEASKPGFIFKDQNGNPIPNTKPGETYEFRQLVADGAAKSGSLATTDPALSGRRIDKITQGGFTYDDAVVETFNEGKYTSQAIAVMHNDARQELLRVAVAQNAAGNPEMLASLRTAAEGIAASPEIQGSVAGNVTALADLAALTSGPEAVNALLATRPKFSPAIPTVGPTVATPVTPIATTPTVAGATPVSIPQVQTPAPAAPPSPPNFFASQQPAAPNPPAPPSTPPNTDPTSLEYWQSPPPIPQDPMQNRQTPPTTPDPDEYHDGMSR